MPTKLILSFIGAILLVAVHPANPQQPPKLAKIGILSARPWTPGGATDVVPRMLRELGHIEGKNVTYEHRYGDNRLERIPALADELVRLKVDVLVTPGINEAIAAKKATQTIPIVFLNLADPIASGLVDSLAHPGGNITGLTNISSVLVGKRLELLKETFPKVARVALLWDPQNPGSVLEWKESRLPARALHLQLHSMEVSSADHFTSAFKEIIKARSTALVVTQSALANSNQRLIADLAIKNRLPAFCPREDWVESGGLMSYGADLNEHNRRGAVFIDKILKGTKPADIPVEQPTKFEFVINLKTAKSINVAIPPEVLARANRIIR